MSSNQSQDEIVKKKKRKYSVLKKKSLILVVLTLCISFGAIAIMMSQLSNAQGYIKGYEVNEKLLLEEEKASFDFLWDHTNQDVNSPGFGLVLDRATNDKMASVASVGFALTGYGIGVENKWISRDEGYQRALGTLKTLYNHAEHIEGFFYHFLNVESAKRYEKVEVSMIDTAIAVNGALFAGEYFGGEVKELADQIYRRINWNWYRNPKTNKFYMEYLPENKEHTGSWGVYAEQFMAYFLSAASPTHAAPADMIYEIDRTSTTWAGMEPYISSPNNSIFTYQFSQAWFDLENLVDNQGYDWYHNSVVATLASRQYSIDTRNIFKTFHENSWGLTACDGPFGYSGQYGANPEKAVDGTIPPCGPAGSVAYTPNLVSDALTYMKSIDGLYDEKYGFKDAYNQEGEGTIIIEDYLSIDKGISMLMIENQRSRLVWDTMNQNEYVIEGKKLTGFSLANTRLFEDGDNVKNHYGIKDKGLKVNKTNQAYDGRQGLKIQMNESTGTMTFKLKSMKLNEIVSSHIQLYVLGTGTFQATVYDRKGEELGKTNAQKVDSKEYQQVILDLDNAEDYYKDIKTIEIQVSSDEKEILVDEIGFIYPENMVRNATISERPYVDGELYAYFDYLGQKTSNEQLFAYQWKIADSMKDEFKDIEGATKPTYTPEKSDVGKYLQVEITPVDKDGKSIGLSSLSQAVSKVSKEMPYVSKDIEEIILKNKGRVPDVITGDTFSVLKYWIDGGQEVYEIGDAGDKLITKFKKENMEYPYMMREITVNDISKFNKLIIRGKGKHKILMKLEQKDGRSIGEVELSLKESGNDYEWDISQHKDLLKNMGRILIFAMPGEPTGEGLFEFDQLEFSVKKATKNVIYSKGQIPSPTNYYQGQTSTFDFNHYWVDGGDNVYTITEKPKGVNSFIYKKKNSPEWANAKTHIAGKLEDFNKVVFELTGPSGTDVLFKVEGQKGSAESGIVKLREGINTIEINLAALTNSQKNSLNDVLFFAVPGSKNGSGTVRVTSAYFSRESFKGSSYVHKYNGNHQDFTFNECWYDSGDGVYDIRCHDHITSVSFEKKNAPEYAYMESFVNGRIKDFKYVNFYVKGTTGKTLIFKLEGKNYNQEYKHIFTGSYDKVSILLDHKQDINSISKVVIMAEPGQRNAQGRFVLDRAYFSNIKLSPAADPVIHKYNGLQKDFTIDNGFEDSQDRVYQIQKKKDYTQVNYYKDKGNEWSSLHANVEGRFSDFKYLYVDVAGYKGQQLLIKLEANGYIKEQIILFNGKRQKIAIEINNQKQLDDLEKILLFAQPGKTGEGTFNIFHLTFSNVEPNNKKINQYDAHKEDFHFNQYWDDSGDGAHDISYQNGITHVDVTKTKGQEYSYMLTRVQGKFSDFNKLILVTEGQRNQQILLKLQTKSQVKEMWLTMTGTKDYFEIDLSDIKDLDTLKQIMLFGMGGKIENGSFDIHDIYFTYQQPEPEVIYNQYDGNKNDFNINKNLLSHQSGIYNFFYQHNQVNISAHKVAGNEWEYYYSPVKGAFSDFKYIDMVMQGKAGEQVLIKVENSQNAQIQKEMYINLTGEVQHVQFDISDLSFRDHIDKVMIFMLPGEFGDSQMKVSQFYFTNTEHYQGNEYKGDKLDFSINQKYQSNVLGKYTFETVGTDTKVISHKTVGDEWTMFSSPVKGQFSDFQYIDIVFKGKTGKQVLLKVENPKDISMNKELWITLTGSLQHVQLDISDLSYRDEIDKVMVFMTPGNTDNSELLISDFYFTNTEYYQGNEYKGDGLDFSIHQKYQSNDEGKYTFEANGANMKIISHKVVGDEWVMFYTPVKGRFSDFQYLDMIVEGKVGEEILIKMGSGSQNKEWKFALTGTKQHVQLDIHDVTFRDTIDKVMIFMNPGSIVNSTLTIFDFFFTNTPYVTSNTYTGGDEFHVNEIWLGNSTHHVDLLQRKITVNKNNDAWSNMSIPVSGDFSSFNYLNIILKGPTGQKLKLKLNECNQEYDMLFKDGLTTFTLPLTNSDGQKLTHLDQLKNIILFGAPGDNDSVYFDFYLYDLCFTNTKPTENIYLGIGNFRLLADQWNCGGVYSKNDTGQIVVNKQNNGYDGTDYMIGDNNQFSKLIIKAKADKNIPVIFKVKNFETSSTITTNVTTIEVLFDKQSIDFITMMAFPGNQTGNGVITIESMELVP